MNAVSLITSFEIDDNVIPAGWTMTLLSQNMFGTSSIQSFQGAGRWLPITLPHNPAVITINNTKCTNINHLTWTLYLSYSQYACPPYCTNKWKRQMMKHTGRGWARDFKSVAADQMKRQNNCITRTNNRIRDAEWHFLLNWFMLVSARPVHIHTRTAVRTGLNVTWHWCSSASCSRVL